MVFNLFENMRLANWNIEEMTGYKPLTTLYTDFSIADKFGENAIIDTYQKAFNELKNNYKYLTELVMVLNWKIWEHNETNEDYARLYNNLWEELSTYAEENLKNEELSYYYRTID